MTKNCLCVCGIVVLICLFAGCNAKDSKQTTETTQPKIITVSNEVESKLAEADRADGKEDHVIEQCYSCALGMHGKSEFAATVKGYEAHFCSQSCRDHFESDPEQVVSTTKIPEPKN